MSHDRLLTASGHPEASVIAHLGSGDPAPFEPADERAATCALAPGAESARRAREFTRITLGGWGMAGIDVAELVVCELVTNALRHGLLSAGWVPEEHPIALTLLRRDPYLMCAVTDPEPGGPVLMEHVPVQKAVVACRSLSRAAPRGAGSQSTVRARSSGRCCQRQSYGGSPTPGR